MNKPRVQNPKNDLISSNIFSDVTYNFNYREKDKLLNVDIKMKTKAVLYFFN